MFRRKSLETAERLLLLFILAVTAVLYFSGDPPPPDTISVRAKILKLEDNTELKAGWLKTGGQKMAVRMLSGPFKNQEVDVANLLVGNLMSDRYVRVGDRVILHLIVSNGRIRSAKLIDYDRQYWHGALFPRLCRPVADLLSRNRIESTGRLCFHRHGDDQSRYSDGHPRL